MIKQCDLAFDELMASEAADYTEQYSAIQAAFMNTPLADMKPDEACDISDVLQRVADLIKNTASCLS